MNFKCKCGKTLAANIEPGQTAFVNCACSLRYMATITESGTLIVCRENGATQSVVFPKGGISQNVDGAEYIIPTSWSNLYKYKGFQGIEPVIAQQHNERQSKQKARLEIELYNAVKREDYEQAAKLRDRIKELEDE